MRRSGALICLLVLVFAIGCARSRGNVPALSDMGALDVGDGVGTMSVFGGVIRFRMPLRVPTANPDDPYGVVVAFLLVLDDHYVSVIVAGPAGDGDYTVLVRDQYVSGTSAGPVMPYRSYENVTVVYDGVMTVTMGTEWAVRAWKYRPRSVKVTVGAIEGQVPIAYRTTMIKETS